MSTTTASTQQEWAVLWPATDDDPQDQERVEMHSETEARRLADMYRHLGAKVAHRAVTRGPWTIAPNGAEK